MKTLKPILFGHLLVGELFKQTQTATAFDKKTDLDANGYYKPYSCGCETGEMNTAIGVDDGIRCHICDSKTVYIEVEAYVEPTVETEAAL